ncbi:hypothetical protein ACHAWF_001786 [Thalassiosira exigua]
MLRDAIRLRLITCHPCPHPWLRHLNKRWRKHEFAARARLSGRAKALGHIPVMREEVLNLWLPGRKYIEATGDNGLIHVIDGTIGLGGHTLAALTLGNANNIRVLGIDRDTVALATAKKRIRSEKVDESRVTFHHGSYSDISPNLLRHLSFPPKVHGILMDLGMNSTQIETASRGFSFRKCGPLDMRFDTTTSEISARDVVNNSSASELAAMFRKFADEPYADEIAANIVQWRQFNPRPKRAQKVTGIQTTMELRYVIEEAVENVKMQLTTDPKENIHQQDKFARFRAIWKSPFKSPRKESKLLKKYEEHKPRHSNHVMRCFQALRIESNKELQHVMDVLSPSSSPISQCLEVGGRLVVMAFNPTEDQVVREGMSGLVNTGDFKYLTPEIDGLRPTLEEFKANGRARTARLRAVERIK